MPLIGRWLVNDAADASRVFVWMLQGAPHWEMAGDAADACRVFRLDGWSMMLLMLVVSFVWMLQSAPHREMAGQ